MKSLEDRVANYKELAARGEHAKEKLRQTMEEKVQSYETIVNQAEQRAQSLEKELLELQAEQQRRQGIVEEQVRSLEESKTKDLRKIRQLEDQVETLKAEATVTELEIKAFEAKLIQVGDQVRSLEDRVATYKAMATRDEHEKEELRQVIEEKSRSYETRANQAEQRAQSLEKDLFQLQTEQTQVVVAEPIMKDRNSDDILGTTMLVFLSLLWYIFVGWPLRILVTTVNLVFSLCIIGIVYSYAYNSGGGGAYWENMPGVF